MASKARGRLAGSGRLRPARRLQPSEARKSRPLHCLTIYLNAERCDKMSRQQVDGLLAIFKLVRPRSRKK